MSVSLREQMFRKINGLNYFLSRKDNRDFIANLNQKPDLFFFSPPYNIGSKSEQKITNRKYGGYDAKSFRSITDYKDNLPEEEYQNNQIDILNLCGEKLNNNGCIVYNHKNRYSNRRLISPYKWIYKTNLELVMEIVWNRGSTHENGRTHLRPVTETLYVLSKPNFVTYFGPKFDDKMDNQSTIWTISKQKENLHNAAFPIELARRVIDYFCPPNGLVCDIYSGSGTTMCASYEKKRGFVGCEILDKYYNLSVERFKELTIKNREFIYA